MAKTIAYDEEARRGLERGLNALAVPGGVWVGSQEGAAYLSDDGRERHRVAGLPDERVHAFLLDSRPAYAGRLWMGTENGLAWCALKKTSTLA